MTQGPLSGVRVLDLSRVLAGPWATQTLADLGAEVIKIEVPNGGDRSRGSSIFPGLPSTYFETNNRGVKSVTLNLKTPEAREILYNPNWPMDAALKLGVEGPFRNVPPQFGYWLGTRDKRGFGTRPSTFRPTSMTARSFSKPTTVPLTTEPSTISVWLSDASSSAAKCAASPSRAVRRLPPTTPAPPGRARSSPAP